MYYKYMKIYHITFQPDNDYVIDDYCLCMKNVSAHAEEKRNDWDK